MSTIHTHLSHHADAATDHRRLCLRAAHAAKARSNQHAARQTLQAQVLPPRVEHRQLGASKILLKNTVGMLHEIYISSLQDHSLLRNALNCIAWD